MALLFIDSFDHYSVAQGSRKWTMFSTVSTMVAGRTGNGLRADFNDFPSKTLGAEYGTLTAGVAYKTQAFENQILKFSNVLNSVAMWLEHVGDGRLRFRFSGGGVSATTSPPSTFVMNLNEWYFFEMQATLTGGPPAHIVATARVNEAEVLSWDFTGGTGVAGMKFATVALEGTGGGSTATVDDFYCTDTEYLGDVRIGVLYPNAAGDLAAWTPNAVGANYTKVMEHPADDDATYVSTPTVGAIDLYNLDDITPSFAGTIKGAQALWLVKKSDTGTGSIKGQWKSAGSTLEGLEFHPSAGVYLYDIQAERKSIFTAADWTQAEINALQIGMKRHS